MVHNINTKRIGVYSANYKLKSGLVLTTLSTVEKSAAVIESDTASAHSSTKYNLVRLRRWIKSSAVHHLAGYAKNAFSCALNRGWLCLSSPKQTSVCPH